MSERGRRRRRRLRLPATRETGRGRGERIEWRIGAGSDRNECDEGCDAGHSTIGGETHDREAGAGDVADGIECVGRAEGANLQLPLKYLVQSTRVPSTKYELPLLLAGACIFSPQFCHSLAEYFWVFLSTPRELGSAER